MFRATSSHLQEDTVVSGRVLQIM